MAGAAAGEGVGVMAREGSRFKGIGEREGEGMAEALFVKTEQARPRDPQMPSLLPGRIDIGRGQVAAVDQMMNGMTRDGEEFGDIADLDEGRNGLLFERGTICNHGVEFMGILTRL